MTSPSHERTRAVVAGLAAALLLLACGCASSPRMGATGPRAPSSSGADSWPARFAPGAQLLDGFDPPATGEAWQPGDAVLLGIALDDHDRRREWYLKVTVVGPLRVRLDGVPLTTGPAQARFAGPRGRTLILRYTDILVAVELFGADLRPISSRTAMMPDLCLRYGLTDSIEFERGGGTLDSADPVPGESVADEQEARCLAGFFGLMRLPTFFDHDPQIGSLVRTLVAHPSLLSILFGGGLRVSISVDTTNAEPATVPLAAGVERPGYRAPVLVEMNGTPALLGELLVTPPAPPLGPCAGVVSFDAHPPGDEGKRIHLQLLAARRTTITVPEIDAGSSPSPPRR